MALNFFWIYIGSLFAGSMGLVFLAKSLVEGLADNGKRPYIYGAMAAVIASLAAYFSTFITADLFQVFWILGGVFLLFGCIHTAFIHQRYFYAHKHNSFKVFIGEVSFGLALLLFTIVLFSCLQYFLQENKTFLYYPMIMSTLVFFLPLLVIHTFDAAYSIPPAEFTTWQYPLQSPIELPDDNYNERLLVIGFEIAKKTSDRKKTYFRAKAPESMKLGELYYHFLNDYNDLHSETTIEYANDDEYDAHEWWFRRKPKWYQGQRILDPYLSIRENGVKENTVIICERIQNLIQE